MSKKCVVISACILGEYCRYDGKTKKFQNIIDAFDGWEIIPFCPEAPLFGTPRERISVVARDNEERIITDETKRNVTEALRKEIESFSDSIQTPDAILLKSKSPSCGSGTTPILDTSGSLLYRGDGIAAKMLKEKYPEIEIADENNFSHIFSV